MLTFSTTSTLRRISWVRSGPLNLELIFGQAIHGLSSVFWIKHYREKIWPTFEREHFLPRVPDGDVIPIFLDDTVFVGVPKGLIGIPFKRRDLDEEKSRVTDEIAFKLVERLG